ncbi:rod shape-determining protein [Micromonospora eburnea]|uniref:Rod shape-determining protein MreB n=1 Tax=Micromonospora eburnea TaxID=227316 RepID=A0A1C6UTW3_9ACTN|nr:rod shape-determining protein [Micromonospora eburnea]SCL57269.1 rod shape-determining protein MreB [Micromonospora eburnea]
MLAAGAYARPGVGHCLALDLGTSTVRLWTSVTGTVISEPAVIARRPGGRRAVGRAAVDAQATEGATLIWPVRDGVVRDLVACVQLLRILLADIGHPCDTGCPVLVGVPATATMRQKNVLVAAVRRATGGRVSAVEEPLAAALACRPDPGHDDLVTVDIGFGRTEVARIVDRSVAAAERVEGADPVDQIPAIARCVRRMSAHDAGTRRRLLITGGGAASPGTAARLAALTGRSVTVPAEPLLATLTGLRLLLTATDATRAD